MKPEEKFRAKIDQEFVKYFNIEREVASTCGKSRIDYILQCKDSNAVFGVEVKKENIKRGTNFGSFIKQANKYKNLQWKHNFDAPKKMLVFISPAISNMFIEIKKDDFGRPILIKGLNNQKFYQPKHDIFCEHHNLNSLIAETLNVGEIKTIKDTYRDKTFSYFAFIYKNKAIWRSCFNLSRGGLHVKNYEFYMNKL